jgi:hypothetical protein
VQPYEFAASAVSNGLTPVFLGNNNPADLSRVLRVEVPDGAQIRYEINNGGRSVSASAASPILSGVQHLQWGAGWNFSFIDATGT